MRERGGERERERGRGRGRKRESSSYESANVHFGQKDAEVVF